MKANAARTAKPTANPIQVPVVAGRAIFHTSGTPPRVSPMKRLYITQRWFTTRSFTGPANATIAPAAHTAITPRTTMDTLRNFSRESSAIASMKRR